LGPVFTAGWWRDRPFHRLNTKPVDSDTWLTFQHVPLTGPPEIAGARAYEWAGSVWRAWSAHHATVNVWLEAAGLLGVAEMAADAGQRQIAAALGPYVATDTG
jgi:hypothetical protein